MFRACPPVPWPRRLLTTLWRAGDKASWLIPVLWLALGLRVLRLDFQPLWWDEGYSVWFATQPLGQMVELTAQDIHPPLYYALLHLWIRLWGAGPVALRLFSVTVGVLTVPMLYWAGCRLTAFLGRPCSQQVAALAAFLLAINPLHIFYSQEVRMYGLVALLSAAILGTAAGLFAQGSRGSQVQGGAGAAWRGLVPYVLLTTAALYTQYYAVFVPLGLTFYALWRWRDDRLALVRWLAAQLVVLLLYLPWLLYAVPRLVPYVSQKVVLDADRPLGLGVYLGRHLAAFLVGHLEGWLAPYWPLALLLVLPLLAGWVLVTPSSVRRGGQAGWGSSEASLQRGAMKAPTQVDVQLQAPQRHVGWWGVGGAGLAGVLVTALLLGWLVGLRYPFFPPRGERLLLLALPPFIVLSAVSIKALGKRRRWAGFGALALMGMAAALSLGGFYTVPRYAGDDYRPLIARSVEQGLPEDTVFCVYPWQVGYWRSYGHRDGPHAILAPAAAWGPAVARALDEALARGRVWFPAHLALGAVLETQIEAYLARSALPFVNEWYGPGTRLSAWAALESPPLSPASARFVLSGPADGNVELVAVGIGNGPVSAANTVIPLALRWQATARPPALAVSVRLTDPLGQIWAQRDYEPLGRLGVECEEGAGCEEAGGGGWSAVDRLGLLIPVGTPVGRYDLQVMVHQKESSRPLNVMAQDGTVLGTALTLAQVDVGPASRALGPERLPIAMRQVVDLGDGLRFLGYSAAATPAAPGELRKVSLFWQATATPTADYIAFVQLLDRAGQVAAGWEAPPGAAFPTSRWGPGTLIRTQAFYRPPATLAPGRYRLIAGLFRNTDKARLRTASGADHLELGLVTIQGRPHQMSPPQPTYPLDVRFGELARLVGFDLGLAAAPGPGATLPLTLYWQATGTTDRAYTVFVHLLGEDGKVWGYGDAEPLGGQVPTTGWLPGEYLADPHEVSIAADAPPGRYRLAVGLYDPGSGQRLLTADGSDVVILSIEGLQW